MRYVIFSQKDDPRTQEAYVEQVGGFGEAFPSRDALLSLAGNFPCDREFSKRAGEYIVFSVGQPRNRMENCATGYRGDTRLSVPMIGFLKLEPAEESNWGERVEALRVKYGGVEHARLVSQESIRRAGPPVEMKSGATASRAESVREDSKGGAVKVGRVSYYRSSRPREFWWRAGQSLAWGGLITYCIYLKAELLEKTEIDRVLVQRLIEVKYEDLARQNRDLQKVFENQKMQIEKNTLDIASFKQSLLGFEKDLKRLSPELSKRRTGKAKTDERPEEM